MYLCGYGVGRFWVESLRTDQLLVPGIGVPVSMVVGAAMAVVAAIWIAVVRSKIAKSGGVQKTDDIQNDKGSGDAAASTGEGTKETE